jgi:hypothetical protein
MAGYGDDAKFNAWMASNGYSLPDGGVAVAVLRQRGSAYVDGLYGSRFSGQPTGGFEQERAWPRVDACAHGQTIPSDVVPVAIEHASYHAVYQEAVSPGSLSVAASTSGAIKREKVDVLEVEYVAGTGDAVADATIRLSAVEGLLAPFFAVAVPAVFVL